MTRLVLSALVVQAMAALAWPDALETRFANPPEAAKPRCYWYWMDGHVSREGITKDIEAMRRAGIGGAYIGVISGQSGAPADTHLKALSEEWWGYIEHAIREAGRIGVEIGLFNSPGWSQSGGPWVKPEQSMRYVSLPEVRIRGSQRFEGKLPAPTGPFQEIAVVAFPAPKGDSEFLEESARAPTSMSITPETLRRSSSTSSASDGMSATAGPLALYGTGGSSRPVRSGKSTPATWPGEPIPTDA